MAASRAVCRYESGERSQLPCCPLCGRKPNRASQDHQSPARIFANSAKNPLSLSSLVNRAILPALNRCGQCGKTETDHAGAAHTFERDARISEWHGWHAARRGLGSNLYRLGVPDIVFSAFCGTPT